MPGLFLSAAYVEIARVSSLTETKRKTMSNYTILVADQGSARVFSRPRKFGDSEKLHAMDHWRGRAHPGDLVTDDAGRTSPSTSEAMDAMREPQEIKETEAKRFAADIGDRLNQLMDQKDKLVVIAAPQFLGTLRDELGDRIDVDLDKNLHNASDEEIADTVDELLKK